jgi:hypothetical protein
VFANLEVPIPNAVAPGEKLRGMTFRLRRYRIKKLGIE